MMLVHDQRLRLPASRTTPAGERLDAFGRWLGEAALPRWRPEGGPIPFAECRGDDGTPADVGYLRLRVVSRQVSVYAQAAARHVETLEAAARGWRGLVDLFWRPDHGWLSRVDGPGRPVADRLDLYDQAFALYACAHYAPLDATGQALDYAQRTVTLIDRRLRTADQPGWRSTADEEGRDQNSHMHYLEALLALHDVAPSDALADRIEELLAIAAHRLVDQRTGALLERFDDDWRPVAEAGHAVEPGHHYEWVWLLAQAARRGFRCAVNPDALYGFAERHGWSVASGLIVDACDARGRTTSPSHRLWPHCEAIRAAATRPTWQGRALAERAAACLLDRFLGGPFPGGWTDRLDVRGRPIDGPVPATSLYHLWEAGLAAASRGWLRIGAQPC